MGLMEAALVSGILKFVANKLVLLLNSQYISIVGATRDLQEFHDLVEGVNDCLETVRNEATGSWLTELKHAAYAAESFVDELQLEVQKHDASGIMTKYLCAIPRSFKFQTKVKAFKNRFSAIVSQSVTIEAGRFSAIVSQSVTIEAGPRVHYIDKIIEERTTVSILNETIVRRDQEMYDIMSKLVEINNQHNIIIVSITGIGGSGKTTLAQMIFNDDIILKHFEVRLWIHVSLEFDVATILGKLFEGITGERSGHYSLQHMSRATSSMLMGKKCLIVLDDIWMDNRFFWQEFMVHLNNCAPGSRILLTTRSKGVADAVDSTYVFQLPALSPENGWLLFREILGTSLSSELEEVGIEIVEKCGGVPLAVKVLAGVLRGKEQIEEWRDIRDAAFFDDVDERRIIFESLLLSYFHMPFHLKQCFTIFSMFPKGYRIDKDKLIDLWIAHDMITPENGVEYLEHIGHSYFDSLLQLSFLQDVSEGYERVTCTMHDLVHDLALAIMDEEILHVPKVLTSSTKSYRYFSITEQPQNHLSENLFEEARAMYVAEGDYFKFIRDLQNSKHLRSIIVTYTESVPTTIFQVKNLKYLEISGLKCEALPEAISDIWSLQVLRLKDCDILKLPESFGNLQNLRTLNLSWCKRIKCLPSSVSNCHMISIMDLSGCIELEVLPDFIGTNKILRVMRIGHTKIKRLPSSVTLLGNLECLDLQKCPELVELPEGLENLKKLVVLNQEGCPKLRPMLVSIEKLRQQKYLNILITGEIGKSAKITELRNINGITYMMSPGDEQKACLKAKTDLQRLQLHWRNDMHKETNLEAVFNGLEPPSGIKELYVGGYAGGQFAQWMLERVDGRVQGMPQFPCLTVMTLCGLPNLKHLDGLMGLPCLKELDLRSMPSLKSISGGPLPSLVKLRMEGLNSLVEMWLEGLGLRCLKELDLRWMPSLESISGGPFPSLVKLRMEGLRNMGEMWMQIGTCLSDLYIEQCTRLIVKPHIPSSLERLVLKRSNEQLLLLPVLGQEASSSSSFPPCYSFSHLKELELWGMAASLSSSPAPPASGSKIGWELLQRMTTLESLKLCQCSGITEIPESIRSLKSLRSLYINFCCAIDMLPEWLGELQSLQKMTIQSCHRLRSLQSIGHLTSLQELRIERCDELHQLPDESLGELHSLQKFYIASLQGLSCLPKSMCQSLEEFEISDCPGLTSLPEWIQGLRSLQKLKITGCPDLERRCEREKGEDWHLIKHIPHLQIGLDEGGPAC